MIQEFLTSALVVCVVAVIVYSVLNTYTSVSSSNTIVSTIQDGKTASTYSNTIVPSKDQPNGIAFSYAGWLRVDDFTYRFGEKKYVFVKGSDDGKQSCPALAIDANTNSLLAIVDTYGMTETVPISNIPAKKWLHFVIGINQTSVSVFINGTLHTYHTLAQLPKQNSGPVHMSTGGGFNGKLGSLDYYPYLLSPADVSGMAVSAPSADPSDKGVGVLPPYFASSWWTKSSQR
jgi:hypothetical protein